MPAGRTGPVLAGVEIAAGIVRVAVLRREDARLRVTGKGEATLADGAVAGGLIVDRGAVAGALELALATAERAGRAERLVVAIDGDDLRTYHTSTTFERDDSTSPVAIGEVSRATKEASSAAAKAASVAVDEDPSLRGVATARLHDDVAALWLDGRALESLVGHRGRLVQVWSDVSVAPLVLSGAAVATVEAARRRGSIVPGAYALGRLLAASGFSDGGVIRVGADVTAVAVLREGRVAATRAFGLGRTSFDGRTASLARDARVWADCVLASLRGLEGLPPARWVFLGVPEGLIAVPKALGEAVGELRGGDIEMAPLAVTLATRAYGDVPLRADDLVAVGAAGLGADVYS